MDEKNALVPTDVAAALENRYGAKPQLFRDQLSLLISADHLIEAVRALRDEFGFAMLSDETAVDYWPQQQPRFHVLYIFRTIQAPYQLIILRVPLDGSAPHIPTVQDLFPNANWFERELWDMFGIFFDGHPDLRRILMPYDWQGHPLRKDYPLGYEEVQFTFNFDDINRRKSRPRE